MLPLKKKRRPKSKNYFTQDTEDAIVLYNNTPCSKIEGIFMIKKYTMRFLNLLKT